MMPPSKYNDQKLKLTETFLSKDIFEWNLNLKWYMQNTYTVNQINPELYQTNNYVVLGNNNISKTSFDLTNMKATIDKTLQKMLKSLSTTE